MAPNYLLGRAESLMVKIDAPGGGGEKRHPYGFIQGQLRLLKKMPAVETELQALPEGACPGNEVVSLLTLHPSYLAKSYFPSKLLANAGLTSIGSRERQLVPDIPSPGVQPGTKEIALDLFISSPRERLREFTAFVKNLTPSSEAANDIRKVEDIRLPDSRQKIRVAPYDPSPMVWEAVLHADASPHGKRIIAEFAKFVKAHDGNALLEKRFHVGGLCFIPVRANLKSTETIASFSHLRVLRGMPRIRPVVRTVGSTLTFDCRVPDRPAQDMKIRAAIFDGGPVNIPSLRPWVTNVEPPGIGAVEPIYQEHAIGVASAFLFNSIHQGEELDRPFSNVDVIRVLDKTTGQDGSDYFDVLKRVDDHLASNDYEFVNLSIGPDWPVEDDEPHAWTAVLDQRFHEKRLLSFCAVGNNGEKNWESGNARVQPPSDCVNAMAIGSADSQGDDWDRSKHSCIGPGRSPGVVRPELLAFGGAPKNPFYVLGTADGTAVPVLGTSYASPSAMRTAVGVRACLGNELGALAIRALLINRSTPHDESSLREVGWGRIEHDVGKLLVSDNRTAHIIYQRSIKPGEWLRASVPIPAGQMTGMVKLTATFCFSSETDPQHTINYTRAGLEVRFRPNFSAKKTEDQKNPNSKSFFSLAKMYGETEAELREDAHKWETVLHNTGNFRGSSLKDPVFDIHYNAREGGANSNSSKAISFALVVTVHCKNEPQLYNQIFTRYRTRLTTLTPIRVPAGFVQK